jgi:hypothetical protein
MALATALSILDGDHRTFDGYWKSVDAALARARAPSCG